MGSWYERSYRRNLVDMHINDSDPFYMSQYDPVQYAENLVAAGVDTAILYAGNCLGICFWPTRAGHMHAGLQGRDILGETIAECRKRGLYVIVYFNIWSRWAYDTHPEWRYRDSSGRGMFVESHGQRYGMCCSNTGYAEYVYAQADDLASRYDMDGFWVDMIGWFGGICFCDACKERYLRESGESFPGVLDWRDARFRNFQRRREVWHAEFAQKIRETVLARKPGISVVFQAASWAHGWKIGLSEALYSQSDYLAGDFYGDPVEQSFVCKYLESVSQHKPIEFMSSRCPTLCEHTVTKQKELLEAQVYSSIANNASYVFIDAIDPAGTLNPATYWTMGRIFAQSRLYEPYLGPQLIRKADVAIYVDIHSLASMRDNGKTIGSDSSGRAFGHDLMETPAKKLLRIAETLIHHNIAYDVVTRKSIDRLAGYQTLILPDAFMLSQMEADAIREYTAGGGSVYASKHSSFVNGQSNFLLSDVFGVSYTGETDENITYLAPRPEYGGLDPFTGAHPLTVDDTQAKVIPLPGAEVLGTLTLPFTPPRDANVYSTAISDPPGRPTDYPALVLNRFGKGRCVYCAGTLEFMPHDAQRRIFAGIVRSLMTRPPCFETDAPRPVEIMVYDDPVSSRKLVCILNFQSILPSIPVFDMHIRINMEGRNPTSVVLLPGEASVPWRAQDGFASFTVERTDIFQMVAVYYQ